MTIAYNVSSVILYFTITHTGVITDGRYDSSNYSYTWFTRIVCEGDEKTLMDCDVYNTSNTCSQQNRALTQVGLQCFRGQNEG